MRTQSIFTGLHCYALLTDSRLRQTKEERSASLTIWFCLHCFFIFETEESIMQTPSPKTLRTKIILLELLSTQSLIIPVKTLYLIHFLVQNADISFFKLIFTFFSFAFELPSGYFSDRYGNRHAVLLSRALIASSFLFYLLLPDFSGFVLANLLLGIGDAWESGAKDSYFLVLCSGPQLDYRQLKIDLAKYSYAVNFCLAFVSTMLYAQSIYLPVLFTVLFYAAATALLLTMPDDACRASRGQTQSFLSLSGQVVSKILKNRALVMEMIFATTCTSILISNFDFYSSLFASAGISVQAIGVIYSSFSLINILGVKLYDRFRSAFLSRLFLFLMPFSFLLLVSGQAALLLIGVFLQELCFAYYSLNLNICVIDSIDDKTSSSYYQSVISFMTVLLRIVLTSAITFAFALLDFSTVYGLFAAVTLCVTVCYFAFRRLPG